MLNSDVGFRESRLNLLVSVRYREKGLNFIDSAAENLIKGLH